MPPNVPDVRVRLAPEGVQEVVNAFKKVEREASQSARVSTRAVDGLSNAVQGLVNLLPAISVAALTREIFTRTVDAERQVNRLNTALKTTGFSAGITAKELNEIAESLKNMTAFDDDEIRKGITALLRFRDVQGDVFREAIKLTADFAAATDRDFVSAAVAIGRALTDPAAGARALREAGVRLSEQQIETATNLKNTGDIAGAQRIVIDALTKSVGGAAAGENVGLYGSTKALSKAWDDLLKAIGKMQTLRGETFFAALTRDIKILAKTIEESQVLRSLLAFATFGLAGTEDRAKTPEEERIAEIDRQLQLARKQLASGTLNPPGGAKSFFSFLIPDIKLGEEALARLQKTVIELEKERAKLVAIRGQGVPPSPAQTAGSDVDQAREGERQRNAERDREFQEKRAKENREHLLDVRKLDAERELQREKQLADARLRILDQYYSQGLISLEEYHKTRRAIIAVELDRELAAIDEKINAEVAINQKAKKEGDFAKDRASLLNIERLVNDRTLRQERASAALISSLLQEAEQREQLGREQLNLEVRLLEAQGRRKDAALLALEEEIRQTEKLLRLRGATPEQIATTVGAARNVATRNIEFEEQGRLGQQALRQIDIEREAINRQVAQGLIFQFEAEERIIDLERNRLPTLRSIAEEMQRVAVSDEQRQQAEEFAAAIDRIAVSINRAGREMAEFKQRAFDAVSSDLATFLTDGIENAKNFGEAIKTLAFNVSRSLNRISADILSRKILEKGLSFLGIAGEGPEKVAQATAVGTAQAAPLTAAATMMQTALVTGAAAVTASAAQLMAAAATLTGAGATAGIGAGLSGSLAATSIVATAGGGFVPALAGGGMVHGPGGPVGDRIPAMLSDGEYVVRAAAVRSIGTELLDAINSGMRVPPIASIRRVPGFAEGGLVGQGAANGIGGRLDIGLGLDDGLVLRALNTPEGERVFVRMAQRNKRSLRGALGI